MKILGIILLCIVSLNILVAQGSQLKGKVVDANSMLPLSGANITLNGSNGVVSDKNGVFAISCNGESVNIKVTYIGYKKYENNFKCNENELIVVNMVADAFQLGNVEVTASSNFNKSQLEQASSIAKIDAVALNRSTGLYLDDAINANIPGVTMQRRSESGGQQINIRGYGNGMGFKGVSNNFDGQGVKMYLNGIPITDAEGLTVMDDIDFGTLSSAEVLKGPAGTLYGMAISGVVNLQSEILPQNTKAVSQEIMGGSYGLLRTTTRLGVAGNNSSLLISYGHQKSDGFMVHTNSEKDFVNLTGSFRLNDNQSMNAYLGYIDSYDARNGELTKAQYDSFDYSGNPRYIKNDAHSAVRTFRAGFGHTYRLNSHISNTSSLFGSSQSMDQSSAGGWTDKTPINYGFRTVFEKFFNLSDEITLSGITGLEVQKMNAFTQGFGMGADSTNLNNYNIITQIRSNQFTTNSTYSYFTQWTVSLPMQFAFTAGIGVSNMSLKLEDRLWALNNNHPNNNNLKVYENSYNNLISPTIALNKKFGEELSVYASYSVAHKAPISSNILIATTGEMNVGLKPEKGTQIEIGTKGNMLDNSLYYTVALFNTKYEDKFTTIAVANPENTATLYTYLVNGGTLNNKGLELMLTYKVIESNSNFIKLLQTTTNFTYSDFKYEDYQFEKVGKNSAKKDTTIIEDYSGKAVAGVAPYVFNIGVDFDTKVGIYGNVFYNYRSSMPYTSDGLNEASSYSLVNAKLGFKQSVSNFDFDLYAGANNISGAQYYNMVFVNQLPDAYIPGPNEINFFGGVNIKYNF
ncbi:MAG TPA: TonB-dependent receptor [Candidatus Kapabacteria bacterium]|nr:TonB-dependent receptor [Candidatus Kapabacteria bacterium]